MKVFTTVMKVLAVLAAIAGIVYVAATYGDKIVAWVNQLKNKLFGRCCDEDLYCEEAMQANEADFEA